MRSITTYNEELEAKVWELKQELGTSSTTYTQKEEVLQKQVRDAHAAQRHAEAQLEAEQKTAGRYRAEVTEL